MHRISLATFLPSMAAALILVAPMRAGWPAEDPAAPERPPHGALSFVTAGARAARPPAPVAPAKQVVSESGDGYLLVGFDQLAGFPFKSPALPAADAPGPSVTTEVMSQIPDRIKKLDGQRVTITGFMLPTRIEKGLATEFLLLNSPLMCCFGVTPSTNAWVVVKMSKGVPPVQDVPLPFPGRLHVRDQWENGWLAGVYRLDGEDLGKPHS
jgi:hypothetical protein